MSESESVTGQELSDQKQLPELKAPNTIWPELGLSAVKTAVQFIPFWGGPIAEILGAALTPVIQRRYEKWLESVFTELSRQLAGHDELLENYTPEKLAQDGAFVSAFLKARLLAIQTEQQEKLDALRNALVNVALGEGPDDSLQIIFLDAVNTLTIWHLRLLDCIDDLEDWAKRHDDYPLHVPADTIDSANIFGAFYHDQLPAEDFHIQLLQDLYNRGFATNNTRPRGQTFPYDEKDTFPRITDLGKKFLAYVSTPRMPESHEQNSQPAEGSHP